MQITTTVKGACAMTGLGPTKLNELIKNRAIDTVKIGRRRLVKVDSLKRLLEAA
jgi:excisionase family DNA binding protein